MGGIGGMKEERKMMQLYFNSKNIFKVLESRLSYLDSD